MESQSQISEASSRNRSSKSKMSLEDYIDFVHSHQTLILTVYHLNQIISMHGFKKIHKVPKKLLTDAVGTLDLAESSRSTLGENVTSFAILTLDDILFDLHDLNWQECCVTSIQTFSSCKQNFLVPANRNLQITMHSQPDLEQKAKKTRGIDEICGLPEASSQHNSEKDKRAKKMVPKRVRKAGARDCDTSLDCDSPVSC
ncbi:Regulator of rDNA transcription protein [Quillaja saponaria]|uniref:Regulator of rDNA transcription protein n=1 Tax=Quillaja saponaria TaxID=32244 RepID=A0AAD7QHI7_QUISA|nr:Regulator of rDNA transcription protein [Quillaja saponaria]